MTSFGAARIAALLEDLGDEALYDKVKTADDGFRVPGEVVSAIVGGTHPVKAWREHGGLTQDALAVKAGISTACLCQIETGKRHGVVKTLRRWPRPWASRWTICKADPIDRTIANTASLRARIGPEGGTIDVAEIGRRQIQAPAPARRIAKGEHGQCIAEKVAAPGIDAAAQRHRG